MSVYEITHLVEQKDLNHHGTLFAAVMAGWFVEMGFVTASYEHKNTKELVCIGVDELRFSKPVLPGTLLKLTGELIHAGTTSLTVKVCAYDGLGGDDTVVSGKITFVTIDEDTRKKKPHGISLPG